MEDEKIISLYFQRNESAITETLRKYGNYCRSIAARILDLHTAEECLNDVMLKLWETIPPTHPASLQAYLSAIVRRISINRLEHDHAQKRGNGQAALLLEELQECVADNTNIEKEYDAKEVVLAIQRFLDTLPKESSNIFMERFGNFRSVTEIAEKYHLTENHINVSLHRIRKKLRKYLKEEGLA